MRNIKLTLQYDGTNYHGWQSQKREGTIQSTVEECILRLTGSRSKLRGAGRTDAGVHALEQVASFSTASGLDINTIKRALNAMLPPDIRITSVSEVDGSFHPRYSAVGKRYFYLIANMNYVSPFIERFIWRVPQRLNIKDMAKAGRLLVGRHDFRGYMASGSSVKDTIREIKRLTVKEMDSIEFLSVSLKGRFIKVTVEGDGFLRHMVRNIIGTLVEVAKGKRKPESVLDIIASGDRKLAGPTAPANGLFLEKVLYTF
jgi:tRNA pseudouridine38-40 synthase